MGTTDTWFLAAGSKEVKRIYAKRLMRSAVPDGTLISGWFYTPAINCRVTPSAVPNGTFCFKAAFLPRSEFRGFTIWRACRHSELFEARIYRNLSKEYSHVISILEADHTRTVSLDTPDVVIKGLIPGSREPSTSKKCHGHNRYVVFGGGIQRGITDIC